jgi:hypothetical protein
MHQISETTATIRQSYCCCFLTFSGGENVIHVLLSSVSGIPSPPPSLSDINQLLVILYLSTTRASTPQYYILCRLLPMCILRTAQTHFRSRDSDWLRPERPSGRSSSTVSVNNSLLHVIQTGSGDHPASYPMGTGGQFPPG